MRTQKRGGGPACPCAQTGGEETNFVSATANTIDRETEKVGKGAAAGPRANPVALEELVSVTGARPNSTGARDLFTEETQTVLVFRDGAVIRLSCAVSVGQLLFLTNKRSKEEVVCQVLNTRAFGPSAAYVELQFTEEKENYWGVAITPGDSGIAEFSAPAQMHMHAVKTTGDAPGAPHKAEDVNKLTEEAALLRQQLHATETGSGAKLRGKMNAAQDVVPVPPMASVAKLLEQLAPLNAAGPEAAAAGAGVLAKAAEELMPVNAPSPVVVAPVAPASAARPAPEMHAAVSTPVVQAVREKPLMPEAAETEKQAPGRAVVGMALPTRKSEEAASAAPEKDASEELLPKPELDFSRIPSGPTIGERARRPLRPPRTVEFRKVKAPALVVLLILVVVSVWIEKPWRYSGWGKTTAAATMPLRTAKPVVAAPKGSETGNATSAPVKGSDAGNAGKSAGAALASGGGANENANQTGDAAEQTAGNAGGKKRGGAAAQVQDGEVDVKPAKAPEIPVADGPVLPAKLVKAANPVYPPDAMRGFITGDVKAEVVVESDGHVGEVKVLSGPKPLQQAAVRALQQYQYAPATQGGKPVASKAEAVVKFWFNP
jgi:TonB family protein